jgi:HEAT repeat protein
MIKSRSRTCACALLLSIALVINASLSAEETEPARRAAVLVKQVIQDESSMIILSGGRDLGDIDMLIKQPHQMEQAVQTIVHSVQNDRMLTPSMRNLLDAAHDEATSPFILLEAHAAIAKIDPASNNAAQLANLLGRIGDRDSVTALINLFQRAVDARPDPGKVDPLDFANSFNRAEVAKHCTWALWNLTGRKRIGKPEEWQTWWNSVEPYFDPVAARREDRPLPEDFDEIIARIQTQPDIAVEQLIAIGISALPELFERIPTADQQSKFLFCKVVDALNRSSDLQPAVQRAYYMRRLTTESLLPGEMRDVWRSALQNASLADFCQISVDAERTLEEQGSTPQMWSYTKLNLQDFFARYGTSQFARQSYHGFPILGGADEAIVADQVLAAVPVLVAALKDENTSVRRCAAEIAATIGMVTNENPPPLMIALRDAMFADENQQAAGTFGSALGRFKSPLVNAAFREGLFSMSDAVVKTSADHIDKDRFPPAQNKELYDRLEELVEHPDSRIRFVSVRSLRSAEPKRLVEHFEFLRKDSDRDVLSELCRAISELKNPMHQQILVRLALEHEDIYLRCDALQALGNPAFDSAMDDLVPLLDDRQMAGWVINTIVSSQGKKALPLLFKLLEENRDPGNFVSQYLPRLTGKTFGSNDKWLQWWHEQQSPK